MVDGVPRSALRPQAWSFSDQVNARQGFLASCVSLYVIQCCAQSAADATSFSCLSVVATSWVITPGVGTSNRVDGAPHGHLHSPWEVVVVAIVIMLVVVVVAVAVVMVLVVGLAVVAVVVVNAVVVGARQPLAIAGLDSSA